MPSTRATRARKAAQVENEPKHKSPVLGAKTRTTRSSAAPKTRQYLQNITNPVAETSPPPARRVVVRMRNLTKDEMSATANDANEIQVAVQNLKLQQKRKNLGSSDSGNESTDHSRVSPTKRVKKVEMEAKSVPTMEAISPIDDSDNVNSSIEDGKIHELSTEASKPNAQSTADNRDGNMDATPIQASPTTYHIDDERPSTSKAAFASAAADSPSPRHGGRRLRSFGKPKAATEASNTNDNVKQDGNKPKHETDSSSTKLRIFISNMYLNAVDRLKLDFPSRCSEDLEYCYQHHYRAEQPITPNHTQSNYLRCALQQQRYGVFIALCTDMCLRGEFPGEGIFTDIIEMVLSFNPKAFNNSSTANFFQKSIELFSMIVHKFPPCWVSMRKFYINFFKCPVDANKISKQNDQPFKSTNVLEIIFELFEAALEKCSKEDLQAKDRSFQVLPDLQDTLSKSPIGTPSSGNMLNIWEWDTHMNHMHTYEALHSTSVRLERLFIALQLMVQILESDLVMWILHHHKTAKDCIFSNEYQPLVVPVFIITKYTRLTEIVSKLFTLFSISVNKGVKREHLIILERFISLVMVTSNIADLEYTPIGVRYPNLGNETKALIGEFFKIFKTHNTANISQYLETIEIIRIPYVRFEFIDHFLKLFHYSSSLPMSPRKITNEFTKKRWLKYKPQADLNKDDDELSREQYLHLLLTGLHDYCEWIGQQNINQLLNNDRPITALKTVTDSTHRWPCKDNEHIMLHENRKDMKDLENELQTAVDMSRPKIDLPTIDICIDQDTVFKYCSDLKYVLILRQVIEQLCTEVGADITEWLDFFVTLAENG